MSSLTIDIEGLTLGEIEEFEEASGSSISAVAKGEGTAKAIVALVWVVKKRENPEFTMDDARAMKLSDVDLDENPTEGGS